MTRIGTPRGREHRQVDDGGFTLLEVLVGMTILSIFLAIFGGSLISMYGSVNRTQQSADAQTSANDVFLRLDREIRYASGISQPAVQSNGDAVVEFVSNYNGPPVCTQLRLTAGGDLQQRTWNQNAQPLVVGAPALLATDVKADTPTNATNTSALVAGPFATIPAAGTANAQQLEIAVKLTDPDTSGKVQRTRHTDVTFTAQNTGTSTSSNTVCSALRTP